MPNCCARLAYLTVVLATLCSCALPPSPELQPVSPQRLISPISLGDGWMLEARGTSASPLCIASRGSQPSGAVLVHVWKSSQSAEISAVVALALGQPARERSAGGQLEVNFSSQPSGFSLADVGPRYDSLPAARGARLAVTTTSRDSSRVAAALPFATRVVMTVRRPGSAPVTVQTLTLPAMQKVMRALSVCADRPTSVTAIRAAAGLPVLPNAGVRATPETPSETPVQAVPASPTGTQPSADVPAWVAPPSTPTIPAQEMPWQSPPPAGTPPATPSAQSEPTPPSARSAVPPTVPAPTGSGPAWQPPPPAR